MLIRINGLPDDAGTNGTEFADTIYGSRLGGDLIFGGGGGDRIFGREGGDSIFGGDARDVLHGNAGNDWLTASIDGGSLFGDKGNDSMAILGGGRAEGGTGNDTFYSGDWTIDGVGVGHADLVGGRGADLFAFTGTWNDTFARSDVLDFRPGQGDRIHLDAYAPFLTPDGGSHLLQIADSPLIADWLDVTNDGRIDAQDEAAGAGVHIDQAANTITVDVFTEALEVHGRTALQTDWIV